MENKYRFDLIFIGRFRTVTEHIHSRWTTVITLCLLIVAILHEIVIFNIGLMTADYYQVLLSKDWFGFCGQTWLALIFICSIAALKSFQEYLSAVLQVEWRFLLTSAVHHRYFTNHNYHKMNMVSDKLDNVDQRIAQDIREFCDHLARVLVNLIIAPLVILYYTYRTYLVVGYLGPLFCTIFFLISALINCGLLSVVVNWVYRRQRSEGDFRYEHIRLKDMSDVIALTSGHIVVKNRCDRLLAKLIAVQECLILRQFFVQIAVCLFQTSSAVIPFLIISIPIFNGQFDNHSVPELSRLIAETAFLTGYLVKSFGRLIDTALDFGTIGGTTHRIAELFESFDVGCENKHADINDNLPLEHLPSEEDKKCFFKFSDVSIADPKNNQLIINDLNLELTKGNNLLICDPNRTAKNAILKVLKGVWTQRSGFVDTNISVDDPKNVLIVTDRPVLKNGSIVERVLYPLTTESIGSVDRNFVQNIIRLMKFFDLDALLKRLNDNIFRPVDNFSLTEEMSIEFVRVLYHKPLVAVFDETMDSLSEDLKNKIYDECRHNDITLLTCTLRPGLESDHMSVISITKIDKKTGDGQFDYTMELIKSVQEVNLDNLDVDIDGTDNKD